jgi:hypothetical protein
MKTIKIKKDGKTFHQFIVTDTQLELARKLGIDEKDYLIEKAKAELDERKEKESK